MMFRKKKHVKKYSIETNRLTRFKLVKSGKNWIRVGLSKLLFLNLLKNQTIREQVIEELNEDEYKNDKIGFVRGLIATGALLGGVTLTQSVVEAEEQPALEKQLNTGNVLATANSAEIGGNSSVPENASVSNSVTDTVSETANSANSLLNNASETTESHSGLTKTSEENAESTTLKESERNSSRFSESISTSASISESTSVSNSTSTSVSTSASKSLSTSASTSASTSESTSASTSASTSVSNSSLNTGSTVAKSETSKPIGNEALSKIIAESLNTLKTIGNRLSQLSSTSSNLVDVTARNGENTNLSYEINEKANENRQKLSAISSSLGEYLVKSVGLPNTEEAVAKVNTTVSAIEEALKNPNTDLTEVIRQSKAAEASIANAVLRANNGKRSTVNGRRMERGVSFREVAPENTPGNTNFGKATVAYVISEEESKNSNSLANGYKPGTYIYATEGRQGNGRAPGSANVATRVEVKNIRNQVYMTSTRQGNTTEWEVTFNNTGERHDNPYFYFTVPKGHVITRMEVWQKDNANSNTTWNLLGKSEGNNTNEASKAFLSNSKSEFLRAAIGNAQNNGGGAYYENVAGVGPSGVGRGSLTSLRDFAFNNPDAYYQTDKISDKIKKAGDFAFNTIEEATANVFAINPKGSARQEMYKFKYTTTSPTNTDDFYMAGFRSLENSRHKNYLQMNGSPERYWLELKPGIPSAFLKWGGGVSSLAPYDISTIADVYDKVTGQKTSLASGNTTYEIIGVTKDSNAIKYDAANKRNGIVLGKGEYRLSAKNSNGASYKLPFKIVTQSDVYEPVINQSQTNGRVSQGQVVPAASVIQKFDDKSSTIPGFVKPDLNEYKDSVNNRGGGPEVIPTTTPITSGVATEEKLHVQRVEWVGGSDRIGSGVGENMAVKARVDGKEVYLSVPDDMDISRLGDDLTNADKQKILQYHDLDGKAQITGTKIGLSKQLRTIYKDNVGGDSVDVSEVFFENVAKSTATRPNVDPKNDGSVVVRPEADNDKLNISYTPTPTTSTTGNTPIQITIKKSGTTWENTNPLPSGVTLNKSNGHLTISEEAVRDKTDVTATSYNFNSDGATNTGTAKAPYQAKSDRFYAVEGENPTQLNPRDFVLDGNGGALPSTTNVTWKIGTLDLSTPGEKTATLIVTKGNETKEVEYNYTVLGKVKPWERNGKSGEFYAFKADRGKDGIVGGNYANNIGVFSKLYTNIDTLSDVASFKYEYRLNNSQSEPLTTKDGSPAFSSVWHTTVESATDNQPTTHHTTYKIIATYRQGRFGTASASDSALTSSATFDYTVVDPQPKQDISTTVGNIESLKSVIANPKTALENANPNVAFPEGSDYNWVSTPDATTVANPGIYVKEVKLTLPESTTNPGHNAGRNSKNVSVPIKVKPKPPQIADDQVTNTGGLPNKGITVTNALPGATVTLTINNRQLPSKTADSSGSVTFTADELADSNGLLQTGTVTVKQSKAFPNPTTNQSETLESGTTTKEITKETEKPKVEVVMQVKDANNNWVD